MEGLTPNSFSHQIRKSVDALRRGGITAFGYVEVTSEPESGARVLIDGIDRKGRVDMVLVGEAGGILIPELPRARSGADRLRGLRLLSTDDRICRYSVLSSTINIRFISFCRLLHGNLDCA